jgi:hypothetical protein
LLRLLSFVAAFGLASSLLMAAVLPIVAYDALAYRLPVIAQWLDLGRIGWVVSDDPVRNGYPLGQEAVSAVVGAATGSLRFAGMTSFLHVAAGGCAIAWLARACGVRASLARAGACLWLLSPMVLLNAPSAYVDAAFAGASIALFCTAAVCTAPGASAWLAWAAGMAAAHVLSLKGTGLPFVAIVTLALAARALWQRKAPPLGQLVLILGAASPGAFWALRNVVHTGNPLWPIQISLAGHVLLPGVGGAEQILDVAHNTPRVLAVYAAPLRVLLTWLQWRGPALDFDYRLSGLGFSWPLCAVPALALFVLRRVRGLQPKATPDAIGFVLLLTAACFVLQPMAWWARYTLWLWGAGALAVASELQRLLAQERKRALVLATCLLACVSSLEAAYALVHVQGLHRIWAHKPAAAPASSVNSSELVSLRHATNAKHWIAPEFWKLGLEHDRDVCRGAWKPMTDNANLDGVMAQFAPRPAMHIVSDDQETWTQTRQAWQDARCPALLLFRGSPVLEFARQDPEVSVTRAVAFDALFVVRPASGRFEASQQP